MRIIDADYLKQMFDVACGANREVFNIADAVYNFAIKIIDDAPTVDITEEQAIDKLHDTGWLLKHDKELSERPTDVNCSHLDYFKFSRYIIHGLVDYMMAHGIDSIEELEEELHRLNQSNHLKEDIEDCKCSTCIYNDVSSVEAPCSKCCHAWDDMYEDADK